MLGHTEAGAWSELPYGLLALSRLLMLLMNPTTVTAQDSVARILRDRVSITFRLRGRELSSSLSFLHLVLGHLFMAACGAMFKGS